MYLDRDTMREVVRRFPTVIQSTAYEVFEEMGEIAALKRTLLRLGRERLGDPTPEQEQAVNRIEDVARLDRMVLAVLKARSWAGLLRTE
jgi:hypothetical protein